MESKTGF